jgi:mono/diheme cytochrome c family protein
MTFVTALRWCFAVLVAAWCAVSLGSVRTTAQDVGTEAQRESGRTLYLRNCAQCHGENGDGVGYATPRLYPRPREFTMGNFKVRSTPSGALPTHQDLVNIIRRGMPYTSMPAWPTLSDQQVSDLAHYLTTFFPAFSNTETPQSVSLPSAPATTTASIELGRELYVENGCVKCHGPVGRSDGPSAETLVDELNHPIRAADLSKRWTFRGGSSREDIFRTMTTGFNGTPMPSYEEALTPEQRWAITDFIVSLSASGEPDYSNLVVARPAVAPIDLARGVANFESAPVAHFPIVGQIMEPGRAFQPAATSVSVQAVYDTESIALLVRWHDMGPQQAGHNGPSLPVPPAEEALTPGPGAAAGESEGSAPPAADPSDPFGVGPVAADPFAVDPFAQPGAQAAAPPPEFSDAVAIQIPSQVATGARKPYFIFGDAQNPVDLWFFDLSRSEPFQFTGRGSADVTPNDTGDLTGVASYDQGEWSVIFTRPLRATSGAPFTPGQFMPVAFSVWDGLSRERGNRRGLTVWYSLYVEPDVVTSAVGPMVRVALLILVLELAVIFQVRRRYGAGGREEAGGGPGLPAATRA